MLGAALGLWLASASLGVLVSVPAVFCATGRCQSCFHLSSRYSHQCDLWLLASAAVHTKRHTRGSEGNRPDGVGFAGLKGLPDGAVTLLLVGAGLLINSAVVGRGPRLRSEVLTVRVSLPEIRYDQPDKIRTLLPHLRERVLRLPGVEAAGLISSSL